MQIFVGDIDEFYCDAVEGEHRRWAVWEVQDVMGGDFVREKLLGRFDTIEQAEKFAEEQRVKYGCA